MTIEVRAITRQSFPEVLSDRIPIVEEILSFLQLPEGWHFGTGQPPTGATVISAIAVAHVLNEIGADCLEAFPDSDGGILIIGYHSDESIEILCHPDGQCDFIHEKNGRDLERVFGLDIGRTREKIRGQQWQGESSFTFFIQNTLAERRAGTPALLSKTRLTAAVYPSLTRTAPKQQVHHYASTFADTTRRQLQVTRQSSGDLTRTSYLQATT